MSNDERQFMEKAIEVSRKCVSESGKPTPKVGAVVVKDGQVPAVAWRGQMEPGDHAEFTALEKLLGSEVVAGATVYTTLEPCVTRNHPKSPCAKRLIERKIARVVIGMLDPNPAMCGKGERLLREHNVEVGRFPTDLAAQVEDLNREFTRQIELSSSTKEIDRHFIEQYSPETLTIGIRQLTTYSRTAIFIAMRPLCSHTWLKSSVASANSRAPRRRPA